MRVHASEWCQTYHRLKLEVYKPPSPSPRLSASRLSGSNPPPFGFNHETKQPQQPVVLIMQPRERIMRYIQPRATAALPAGPGYRRQRSTSSVVVLILLGITTFTIEHPCRRRLLPLPLEEDTHPPRAAARRNKAIQGVELANQLADAHVHGPLGRGVGVLRVGHAQLLQDLVLARREGRGRRG